MKKFIGLLSCILIMTSSGPSFCTYLDYYNNFINSVDVTRPVTYDNLTWMEHDYTDQRLRAYVSDAETKGLISPSEAGKLNDLIDQYVLMFNESTDYVYATETKIPESYKAGIAKSLHRSNPTGSDYRMFKDGKQIYICYTIDHIEAVIDLMVYGLIDETSPFLDLNAIPTYADGVIMAVKLVGGEPQALQGNLTSPFVGVPEYAKDYIAYAHTYGILNKATEGTEWINDPLTFEQYTAMLLRGLEKPVTDEYVSGDILSAKFACTRLPSMLPRFGTFYDIQQSCNKPMAGEPMRNGDLISYANRLMYEDTFNTHQFVIDRLMEKNVVSIAAKDFMKAKDYYAIYYDVPGNRGNDINEFTKLLFDYDRTYPFLNFSSYVANYYEFWSVPDNTLAKVTLATNYIDLNQAQGITSSILMDLGFSKNEVNAYMTKMMTTKHKTNDRHILSGNGYTIEGCYVDYNDIIVLNFLKK